MQCQGISCDYSCIYLILSDDSNEKKPTTATSSKSPMFGRLTGKSSGGKTMTSSSSTPSAAAIVSSASAKSIDSVDITTRKQSLDNQPSPKHTSKPSKLFGGFGLGRHKNNSGGPTLKSPTSPPPVGKLK
jgi:hypothetical protein